MTVTRITAALLNAALILSAIAAIVVAVRIILEQMLSIGSWYWGGAIAVFAAPPLLAAALRIVQGRTVLRERIDA